MNLNLKVSTRQPCKRLPGTAPFRPHLLHSSTKCLVLPHPAYMYMCMCIYMYMYMYMLWCICICIRCMCMYMYMMYVYVYVCVCICIWCICIWCIYICVCVCICIWCMCMYMYIMYMYMMYMYMMYVYVYVCVCICIWCICICVCVCICIYECTYTHIYLLIHFISKNLFYIPNAALSQLSPHRPSSRSSSPLRRWSPPPHASTLTYYVSKGLGASSHTEARQGSLVGERIPQTGNSFSTCSSCWETHMETELHICAPGLCPACVYSLVSVSVSESSQGPG